MKNPENFSRQVESDKTDNQPIEVIEITQEELVEVSSLIKEIRFMMKSSHLVRWLHDQVVDFSSELEQAYRDKRLPDNPRKSALFHLMIGSTVPASMAVFDFSGPYSIRDFLIVLKKNLTALFD